MGHIGLPGGRWPVLLAPLAAAVAAAAVMAGPAAASGQPTPAGAASRASLARQAIAYVTGGANTATVTPIRTATNTALPPGSGPPSTPDHQHGYAQDLP